MPTVTNTSPDRRVWTRLQREDGRTLELGPGESAENVELPEGFTSQFLSVATERATRTPSRRQTPRKDADPTPEVEAPAPDQEPVVEAEPAPAPDEDR
ncbi:MAG TPA: hypothetical protein VNG12_18450 [Acidimicrobiales bacterium]|nr:hypothetical protein [Acidimicrobiales bacterium]